MKTIFILMIALIMTSCAAYRPTHEMLIKSGFTEHKVAGTDNSIFSTYSRTLKSKTFTELSYMVGVNQWVIWSGQNGQSIEYIKFTVDSKKEFKMVLSNLK